MKYFILVLVTILHLKYDKIHNNLEHNKILMKLKHECINQNLDVDWVYLKTHLFKKKNKSQYVNLSN